MCERIARSNWNETEQNEMRNLLFVHIFVRQYSLFIRLLCCIVHRIHVAFTFRLKWKVFSFTSTAFHVHCSQQSRAYAFWKFFYCIKRWMDVKLFIILQNYLSFFFLLRSHCTSVLLTPCANVCNSAWMNSKYIFEICLVGEHFSFIRFLFLWRHKMLLKLNICAAQRAHFSEIWK